MKIAFVLPTRNRPGRLAQTLDALARLDLTPANAQIIVVDNASDPPARAPRTLANALELTLLRLEQNHGAAARNHAVAATDHACEWIVMLDDDSHPADTRFLRTLQTAPPDVLAIAADIHLPARRTRERGGLPEVFIGCGAAIRRHAFLHARGYDPRFDYYAEEYDLAAKLLLAHGRVAFDPHFRVLHHKVHSGRDMNRILHRLVRNNGWIMQRYAPEPDRRAELRTLRARYRDIARNENATPGLARGLAELRRSIRAQQRSPLPRPLWDRFTGLAHARNALHRAHKLHPFTTAAIVAPGKNCHLILHALHELGVRLTHQNHADARVIGTLSPGPLLDALEREPSHGPPLIAPWDGYAALPETPNPPQAARSESPPPPLAARAT